MWKPFYNTQLAHKLQIKYLSLKTDFNVFAIILKLSLIFRLNVSDWMCPEPRKPGWILTASYIHHLVMTFWMLWESIGLPVCMYYGNCVVKGFKLLNASIPSFSKWSLGMIIFKKIFILRNSPANLASKEDVSRCLQFFFCKSVRVKTVRKVGGKN